MNETSSPTPPPLNVTVRSRKGLGCLPLGCLILVIGLMVVGGMVGGLMWLFYRGGQAFVSDRPAQIRVAAADADGQKYQDVLAKLAPLGEAMNKGTAATVELAPEDFNVLAARSPFTEAWRGKVFLETKSGQLVAEVSVPLNDDQTHPVYFNGRATLEASYASNGFVLYLRKLEPLEPGKANTKFAQFLNNGSMLQALGQEISRNVNDNLRQSARRDANTADILRRLRTVVVTGDKIVITLGENPGRKPSEAPETTPAPVASPANQT